MHKMKICLKASIWKFSSKRWFFFPICLTISELLWLAHYASCFNNSALGGKVLGLQISSPVFLF